MRNLNTVGVVLALLAFVACKSQATNGDRASGAEAALPTPPPPPPPPPPLPPQQGGPISWGGYADHPVRPSADGAAALVHSDWPVLHATLPQVRLSDVSGTRNPGRVFNPDANRNYFPEYRSASDEFDRAELTKQLIARTSARAAALAGGKVRVPFTLRFGEYDFARGAFPVTYSLPTRKNLTIRSPEDGDFRVQMGIRQNPTVFPRMLALEPARAKKFAASLPQNRRLDAIAIATPDSKGIKTRPGMNWMIKHPVIVFKVDSIVVLADDGQVLFVTP